MGRFVNPDNSAFQVALNSPIYVDKTGLLEYTNSVLNTTEAYICNCRPRRFGKSYAANMLAAYYSKGCNSEEMFSGLDISRESDFKTHLNKYDVIHLDIQWFLSNCDNVDNVVAFITKSVQAELREIYPGVLPEEEISLSESLSRIKNIVGQKFIIIIDEWDVLIRDEAANKKVQEKYINFLRAMFKGTEPTKYIQLVYLTGILPIKKEKTQSALNNFDEFTMLDAGVMAPYIGFTEAEVKDLCERYHRDFEKVTIRQYRSGVVNIPLGCKRINYGDRMEYMPQCDLVVSATASPNFTLKEELFQGIRTKDDLILIDLAVPRDIEPSVGKIQGVTLYDMDSFRIEEVPAELQENLEAAGAIVREQMDEFFQWLDGRDLIPRIQDIKDEAVNDLNLRIAKILKKTPMEEDDRQNLVHAVDTAAGKVVNKLIFGLRDSLNQEIFLECVAGLEKIYEE